MNTQMLVSHLANSLRSVKRVAYRRVNCEWIAVTLSSLAVIGLLYGFRPDLAFQLAQPLFAAEIALNILLIAIAGFSAASFAYPDRAGTPLLGPLLAAVFAGYSAVALLTAFRAPAMLDGVVNTVPHGLQCLLCILAFAAVPAAWMLWRLRGLASTRPMLTGMAALLLAAATGSLGVRLVEIETAPDGLIVWHYLPLLVLSGAGLVAGRKIFRW